MNLNRRRFLLGFASLGGLSATLATQFWEQKTATQNPNVPQKDTVRIVVISDLNSQYGSTDYEPEVDKAIALIPQWNPDLVLCSGDMIAGQKATLTQSQIEAMWAAFDRHIAAPLRNHNIPFGFTIGNHDGSGAIVKGKAIFANERSLASAYWQAPEHNPGLNFVDKSQFPFYYTFKHHHIFFLVWDASTHIISPSQLAWVEQSLASKEAKTAKMRFAIGHLPLYAVAVGRDKPGEYLAQADKLRSLLENYQVHTYISGHHHAYYPGKKEQLELLYTGALGSGPRQLLNSDLSPLKTITIVDINLSTNKTLYNTYNIQTLETINDISLPPVIFAPNGQIMRRDL